MLAIHGWLDNAATFTGLAPLLEGFRITALDLSGHGRSQHRPEAHSHYFVDWVPEIVDAADLLGFDRFVLLGHSMGAGISSLIPAAVPGRIAAIGPSRRCWPPDDAAGGGADPAADGARGRASNRRRTARIHPDLGSAVAARCQGTDLNPASARILVERSVEAVPDGVRFTFDPRLKTRSRWRFTEEQVLAFLAVIDCPVLAVRAASGWPVPEEQMNMSVSTPSPTSTRVEVEGGHHVHLTHPERVAPSVRKFLEDSRPI